MRGAALTAVLAMVCGLAVLGPGRAAADTPSGVTATITSPADGAGLDPDKKSNVTVTATAVPAAPGATIRSLQLLVDQEGVYNANCSPQLAKCSFSWSVSTLRWTTPNHTLQALAEASDNSNVRGPVVTVHLFSPTTVNVQPSETWAAGTTVSVGGTLSVLSTGYPAVGAPVTLHFTPTYGSPSTVTTTTGPQGQFSANYRLPATTKVSVSGGGTTRWGSSTGSTSFIASKSFTCSLSPGTVKHGKSATVSCKISGLPSGVVTTFSYGTKTSSTTLHGHSTSGKISFSFKPKKAGKIQIGVTFASNKVYTFSVWSEKITVK